jgi:Dirigent-like protein
MRRASLVAAALVSLGALAVVAPAAGLIGGRLAGAASPTPAADSASAFTSSRAFSLIEVSIPKNERPLGAFTFDRPPVGGDQFAVKNALYMKGARVGRVEVLHTFITGFGSDFTRKATMLFETQIYLQGGTMFVQGYGQVSANGPTKITFPIVGGTGAYANARGYLDFRTLGGPKSKLEFHLT